ncbi:hypothetical protein BZL30_9396 [Mycobacterium kansasii]|uniref:DUF4190 domain-containing protein n=1 Tax=Mycobacterium kansasii TaxID=1768 RepID=A0A1V3W9T6_MYCKA|nr:hypothetical protein BZL30_9396 [Mycobacterium kansasii]
MLSAILAVPMPPAAVVLGHLALPRIRRTGERGRLAAILGLVTGYLMCAVLLAGRSGWHRLVARRRVGTRPRRPVHRRCRRRRQRRRRS